VKKSRYIYVVLALLLLVAGYLVIQNRTGDTGLSSSEFSIRDTADVEFISIESGTQNVVLTRDGQTWKVNGQFSAGGEKVRGLLILLSRIKITGIVQSGLYEEVGNNLNQAGKKIIIADSKKVISSFFVFHDTIYSDYTYMIHENGNTIFRIEVPGVKYRNLAVLFHAETAFWRSNILFQLRPEEIRNIQCAFPAYPTYSFQLVNDGGTDPKILTLTDSSELSNIDQDLVQRYLSYFSWVPLDQYLSESDVDSQYELRDDEPEAQIRVTGLNGNITEIDIYTVYYYDDTGGVHVNLNDVLLRINQSEWARMKYVDLDPIVKQIDYFKSD